MKITRIETILLAEWRPMLFVVVETDEGVTGLGEAGLTGREHAIEGMIKSLESLLIGQNPFRIEYLWQTMWRSGFYPAGQVLTAAIAAIDIALHDLKGKALGVPVYELLGGRSRNRVLTYCHLHGKTPEETLQQAKDRIAEGWRCLRWEMAHDDDMIMDSARSVENAITEFAQLRGELGPEIELVFDAHTKLTPPEAAYFCRSVEEYRPYFVEDPLRSEHTDAYSILRNQTTVPLAAGEQFATKWDFRSLLHRNLIDFARVDVCIAGGLTEAHKVAAICETNMIELAVHNPIGPVSTAACLHLNLACQNVSVQELPKRPGECLHDLIETDQRWEDGYLRLTGASGLGVSLNRKALDRYPYRHELPPLLRRRDGSFANW